MTKLNAPSQTPQTAEHTRTKATGIMDQFQAAAIDLDKHLEALREAGIFALEEEIALSRVDDSELVINAKGQLCERSVSREMDFDGISTNKEIHGTAWPIETVKAVRRYKLHACVRKIHEYLDMLQPIAKRAADVMRESMETIEIKPDTQPALPSGS